MKILQQNSRKQIDFILIFALLALCVLGGIFVYSASYYVAEKDYDSKYYFLKKQIIGYVIGWIAFILASVLDYRKIKKYSLVFLIISLILLALVLTPLGKEVYGAKRWIGLGSFTIQPSDISKLAFVIFASTYLSKDLSRITTFKGLLPVLIVGGITCVLIIAEPNMSITVCVGLLMLSLLFISGTQIKHFAIIV